MIYPQIDECFTLVNDYNLKVRHRSAHLARSMMTILVDIFEPWGNLPVSITNYPSVTVFKSGRASWMRMAPNDDCSFVHAPVTFAHSK